MTSNCLIKYHEIGNFSFIQCQFLLLLTLYPYFLQRIWWILAKDINIKINWIYVVTLIMIVDPISLSILLSHYYYDQMIALISMITITCRFWLFLKRGRVTMCVPIALRSPPVHLILWMISLILDALPVHMKHASYLEEM
jgi:hypothetical protein